MMVAAITQPTKEIGPRTIVIEKEGNFPVTIIARTGQKIKYLYKFTLYRTCVEYDVTNVFFAGDFYEDTVELEAYGITMQTISFLGIDRQESKVEDLGIMSAQNWQVSGLFAELLRKRIVVDLEKSGKDAPILMPEQIIDQIVKQEIARMNKQSGSYGNPFRKAAERKLSQDLKHNMDIPSRLNNMFGNQTNTLGED